MQKYAQLEPKYVAVSKIPFDDVKYQVTCKKREKFVTLKEL